MLHDFLINLKNTCKCNTLDRTEQDQLPQNQKNACKMHCFCSHKQIPDYIYSGQPSLAMQAKFGTAPRIQLNDSYKTTKDILDFVAAERDKLSEADRASMTICLKADQTTKMGIVTDVKQELRRANALKVSYAASKSLGY